MGTRKRDAVVELENEHERLLSDLDRRLIAGRGDVELADTDAADGAARLLTADGDDLALAVQMALEVLGFVVVDMDQVHPEGDRREDLRVQGPDRPGGEAIVEMKGSGNRSPRTKLTELNRLLTEMPAPRRAMTRTPTSDLTGRATPTGPDA
ncbi:hypothetical protein [Amycolatopsis sp. w19]|uniref:hypothetical protein n=1 Tax=Amycolatopsis sp. w19 TaxID=3448134 RepID=UPI003F1D9849